MITGPWGIGKTFLIKKFLREQFGDNGKYIYVSLYGLTSSDELDAAVFQAAYPALASKAVQVGGRLGKAALKFVLRFDPEFKFRDLPKPDADLYVFDDLDADQQSDGLR